MTVYMPAPQRPVGSRYTLDAEGSGLGSRQRLLARMPPRCTGDCNTELHFGLFFDGTNNNKDRDFEKNPPAHSNVARLYDVFDHSQAENKRRYIPGVGTKAVNEVGDSGVGREHVAGAGAGWGGEARINWALLQIHNMLHEYFTANPMHDDVASQRIARQMSADMSMRPMQLQKLGQSEVEVLSKVWDSTALLEIANTALATPIPALRRNLLQHSRRELGKKLEGELRGLPRVVKIRISVFGFSRGAAMARTFCNWLPDALDGEGRMSLLGIPVEVNFLGLFDTVASVGVAQSVLVADGHQAWGDEPFMRIPAYVQRCVHMVAAHEVRGSFPLDLVSGSQCFELLYPGVHSDVGGGYQAGEQGKASAGDSHKLSQIPLADMYRIAVAEGVPLNLKGRFVTAEMGAAMEVSPLLEADFNAYMAATQSLPSPGNRAATRSRTAAQVQVHYGLYLRWRRLRLGPGGQDLARQPFAQRAQAYSRQDYADLVQANNELREEYEELKAREHDGAFRYQDSISAILRSLSLPYAARDSLLRAIWGEKMRQWQMVKPVWENRQPLPTAVIRMLDEHVHDSRAWFKPFGARNNEVWLLQQRRRMAQLEQQEARYETWQRLYRPVIDGVRKQAEQGGFVMAPHLPPMPPSLSDREKQELEHWRRQGRQDRGLPQELTGREPRSLWGYLRWRTLYLDGRPVWAAPTLAEVLASASAAAHDTADQIKREAARQTGRVLKRLPSLPRLPRLPNIPRPR